MTQARAEYEAKYARRKQTEEAAASETAVPVAAEGTLAASPAAEPVMPA
jgi:hypothetical protein